MKEQSVQEIVVIADHQMHAKGGDIPKVIHDPDRQDHQVLIDLADQNEGKVNWLKMRMILVSNRV